MRSLSVLMWPHPLHPICFIFERVWFISASGPLHLLLSLFTMPSSILQSIYQTFSLFLCEHLSPPTIPPFVHFVLDCIPHTKMQVFPGWGKALTDLHTFPGSQHTSDPLLQVDWAAENDSILV